VCVCVCVCVCVLCVCNAKSRLLYYYSVVYIVYVIDDLVNRIKPMSIPSSKRNSFLHILIRRRHFYHLSQNTVSWSGQNLFDINIRSVNIVNSFTNKLPSCVVIIRFQKTCCTQTAWQSLVCYQQMRFVRWYTSVVYGYEHSTRQKLKRVLFCNRL
jgi:hypothetical protein